jgi:hypothetical protein
MPFMPYSRRDVTLLAATLAAAATSRGAEKPKLPTAVLNRD